MILKHTTGRCYARQQFKQEPVRFKVSLPRHNKLVLKIKFTAKIVFLDNGAVLYAGDTTSAFSTTTILGKHRAAFRQSAKAIRLAFVMTRIVFYFVYPNRLRTDLGSVFTFDRWRQLNSLEESQLCPSGVEGHSFLKFGDCVHAPLWKNYGTMRHVFFSVPAVFAKHNSCGIKRGNWNKSFVLPRVVFGSFLRFPVLNKDVTAQIEREKSLKLLSQAKTEPLLTRRYSKNYSKIFCVIQMEGTSFVRR